MRADIEERPAIRNPIGDTKRDCKCKWTLLFIFKKQSQRTPVMYSKIVFRTHNRRQGHCQGQDILKEWLDCRRSDR